MLRESIKDVLQNEMTVEHDRCMVYFDGGDICIEFDDGNEPVYVQFFEPDEIDEAVDVFVEFIQNEQQTHVINWVKEGF
jgi:hypothetical protein